MTVRLPGPATPRRRRRRGGEADSYPTTYDRTRVVDQLPVRILTSYRTDKGSGTDLDDLKGYSGRVAIDLSAQNLTARRQDLTYDLAGRSRSTTAQVGAPLTVVASAALPGTDPATVGTATPDATTGARKDLGTTNGDLSRSADGTTQVQWASILPRRSSARRRPSGSCSTRRTSSSRPSTSAFEPGLVTDRRWAR